MAKKLEKVVEEVKAFETEIVLKVKSAFHTIFTRFGKVEFTDGKAVVPANQPELIDELKNLDAVESVAPVALVAEAPEAPAEDAK